jgi:polysaccharide biosynthesis/export protein
MRKTVTIFFLIVLITVPIIAGAQGNAASGTPGVNETKEPAISADNNEYVIGPEDVLLIYVWREESLTRTVPVRIDGKISLPLVNDIQAAGLTPLQLKDVLAQKFKGFMENPTVTVTVMEANSYKAYVSGEVRQPGVYPVRNKLSLVQLIIGVGGFTEWANQRKILIITRENGTEKRITADYKAIIEGDAPDIPIHPGDIVVVK